MAAYGACITVSSAMAATVVATMWSAHNMSLRTNISCMSRDGSAHQHANKHASISRYRAPMGLQIIACMDPCSYVAWLVPLRGLTARYCAPMGLHIIACMHSCAYFAWLASLNVARLHLNANPLIMMHGSSLSWFVPPGPRLLSMLSPIQYAAYRSHCSKAPDAVG
jgi:hypothetical protein